MDSSKLYYFLHPYISNKHSTKENISACIGYVQDLSKLNITVFSPTLFLHFLYSKTFICSDYLRQIDGVILDRCDGLIISPFYNIKVDKKSIKSIISYFELNNLPIYEFETLVKKDFYD